MTGRMAGVWALGFLALPLLTLSPRSAASTELSEADASLVWLEKEHEVRARALEERIGRLKEQVRVKGAHFHALEQGPGALLHAWENDEDPSALSRDRFKKLIRLSLRYQLSEIQHLTKRLSEVEAERDWIRAQLQGGVPAGRVSATSDAGEPGVRCASLPLAPSPEGLRLIHEFGRRRDPETGIEWRSTGWWLALGEDRHVKACAPGKVVFSGVVPGRRRVVMVEHRSARAGGSITVYANLREDSGPAVGAAVRVGESLGEAVEKLYFEVRSAGFAIDPRQAFSRLQLDGLTSAPYTKGL